jgi:NAD-dependent SIR2 family protein deacetylase
MIDFIGLGDNISTCKLAVPGGGLQPVCAVCEPALVKTIVWFGEVPSLLTQQ